MEHENERPELLTDVDLNHVLHCIAKESPTGYEYMATLCSMLGIEFPPKEKDKK